MKTRDDLFPLNDSIAPFEDRIARLFSESGIR